MMPPPPTMRGGPQQPPPRAPPGQSAFTAPPPRGFTTGGVPSSSVTIGPPHALPPPRGGPQVPAGQPSLSGAQPTGPAMMQMNGGQASNSMMPRGIGGIAPPGPAHSNGSHIPVTPSSGRPGISSLNTPAGPSNAIGAPRPQLSQPGIPPPGPPGGAPGPMRMGPPPPPTSSSTMGPPPSSTSSMGPLPRPGMPTTTVATPRPMMTGPPQTPQGAPRPMPGPQTPRPIMGQPSVRPPMSVNGPGLQQRPPSPMGMGPPQSQPRPMMPMPTPGAPQQRPPSPSMMMPPMGGQPRPPSPSTGMMMMGQQRPPSPSAGMMPPPGGAQLPPRGPMPRPPFAPVGQQTQPRGGFAPPPPSQPGAAAMAPRPMTLGVPPGGQAPVARPSPIMPMQPPGAPAGAQPTGRIQSARIPRPNLEQIAQPHRFFSQHLESHTNCLEPFPSASVPYVCVDNGQANCRFMRPTTRLLACSSQVVDEMKLPLAVVATPFADLAPGEVAPVPLSEWIHEQGPVRCSRCKAYLNCYIRASADFAKWECSLCGHTNDTPTHYRAFAQGAQVPELRFGSVEFEVPPAFFQQSQVILHAGQDQDFCFVLDQTQVAIRSGLFSFSLRTILNLARQQQKPAFPPNARIGFISYDETCVYFYDYTSNSKKPRILISGDCEEGFSPLPASGFMVPVTDSLALEALVQFISSSQAAAQAQQGAAAEKTVSNVGGAAVMSAYSALRETGGRIVMMMSSMPTKGQGKLAEREQPALIGTEQEMILYSAEKEERFYNDLSLKCLASSIAVDLFVCGAAFVDAAVLVQMPSTTGGTFQRIVGFQAANPCHRFELETKLMQTLKSSRAMGVVMKARTSSGLRVARYVGHGFPEEGSYKVASVSSDYSIAIELEHDGTKLEDSKSRGIVQLALLYITPDGKKRLRVHNMAMQAKESPAIVMSSFDPLTVAAFWGKLVSLELAEMSLSKARDSLVKRLLDVTRTMQRIGSGSSRRHALTEPLELLTLYVLALLKSPALLLNRPLDRGVRDPYARADARILSRFHLLWACPEKFSREIYPALFDLSDQPGTLYGEPLPVTASSVAELPPAGTTATTIRLPPRLPCSSEYLRAEGVFLLYDGQEQLDLFIGSRANPQVVEQILGMIPSPDIKVGVVQERSNNKLSQAVYRVCRQLLEDYGGIQLPQEGQPIPVNLASGASAEFFAENRQFLAKLVEDKIYAEQSYGSFVNHMYQLVESTKN